MSAHVPPRPLPLPPQEQDPDREAISDVLRGDRSAFARLVQRYNHRLYRAVRAVLPTDAEAEDALQCAWIRIYERLASFRGDASFATWATRIAVHLGIDHARRRRPSMAEVVDLVDERRPDQALDTAQLGLLLERCLAAMPQGSREVMVLRDILELDTAETAACLQLSEEAVRVRLHRARATLAAAVSEHLAEHARGVYGFAGHRCELLTARVMTQICGNAWPPTSV